LGRDYFFSFFYKRLILLSATNKNVAIYVDRFFDVERTKQKKTVKWDA